MYVAMLEVRLKLTAGESLKYKRRMVKSLCDRIKSRFKVAVAEVDQQEAWQLAVIGVSGVGSDAKTLQSLLDKIIYFLQEEAAGDFILLDIHQDILLFQNP